MNKQLLIMVGIPGSGKTTYAKEVLIPMYKKDGFDIKYISRDEIRFSMLAETDHYFAKEKEVFKAFIQSISEGIENCDIVIADATHINATSRAKLYHSLKETIDKYNVEIVAIVMDTPIVTCIERNEKRSGKNSVPASVIVNMYNNLKKPTSKETFIKEIRYVR